MSLGGVTIAGKTRDFFVVVVVVAYLSDRIYAIVR